MEQPEGYLIDVTVHEDREEKERLDEIEKILVIKKDERKSVDEKQDETEEIQTNLKRNETETKNKSFLHVKYDKIKKSPEIYIATILLNGNYRFDFSETL